MVKKTKEIEVNLYDFNAHDEEEKIDKKKKRRKSKNKKVKNIEKVKQDEKQNRINLNNEIVIGLPKNEDIKQNNKNKKVKRNVNKKSKKKSKKVIKNKKINKPISKKKQEIKNRKIKRNLKILKYSFLIICTLAIIIGTMTSPLFNINEIIIEGNEKITKDEIISLSKIRTEENTYKINLNKSKKQILQNPYINQVEIKRRLPSKIVITVKERKATYMLEHGSGYIYINNQGYMLEVSTQKLNVPILQGAQTSSEEFTPGNRLCIEDLNKMSTIIKIMEIAESNEIANLITRIDMQNSKNYKILFESEKKVAHVGDETDLNTKMLSIKSILEREKEVAGEIFVNNDLKTNNPIFRQSV